MWNRAFEQADKVQYPDRLKTVLLSLCHYVDLVLPGLNVPDMDGIGQQHLFINSQEDIDSSPAAKPSPRTTPLADRRTPSRRSRSNTPGSIKLSVLSQRRIEATPDGKRLRSARRSATPKLRHNDSQIQFAAIASSSPGHDIMESQILTERQKEVRDRQQGSDALFPELRSSVEEDKPELRSFEQRCIPSVSSPEKVTTPKSHRSFEDYVSSTPTPRRGQAHLMDVNDHEMTDDIPSSPPDPRRYPLVPEINKPLSSSSSVLDDWQFMSSPVLGSPRHMRFAISDEQGIREPSRIQIPDRVEPGGKEPENPGTGSSEDEAESADVEDQGTDAPMGGIEDKLPPASQRPATPPNTRARKEHATPKSDNEVFVDALTSPTCTPRSQRALARAAQSVPIQAPKASQSKDRSFDASDVDERSLLRLVVEIDSRKCEDASEDPHEGDERRVSSQEPRGSPHLGCITVVTRSDKPTRRSKRSKVAKSSSPVIPVTPSEIVVSSQESNNKSKNKRKRVSEQSQESDSKKRRHSQDLRSGTEAVPYSQLPHVHDSKPSMPPNMAETAANLQPRHVVSALGDFWRRTTDKLLAKVFQSSPRC